MMSKRAALWLALGGLVSGGTMASATAADRTHSNNSPPTVPASTSSSHAIAQVGFLDRLTGSQDESCDSTYVCEDACDCDPCCDGGSGGALTCLFDCDLGEPFSLFGEYNGFSIGGWVQTGYHTNAVPLFNSRPDEFNLHQAWVYAEKAIDTTDGFDIGGRIDYLYGIDAQDTQAFGVGNGHWDTDFVNGEYGHAIPQLYAEAGYGDISIKAGHFYTIIGWEVVGAPDNFFYSHAYTMYNSEPFTHTGALATASICDDLEVYGGYVLGWDSGFEDNGDAFLGGASLAVCDDITVIYATVGGRFGDSQVGTSEQGYMHSIVTDVTVTDRLQYIAQSDFLSTEDGITGATVRETFGFNQYLIYTLSDCLALGARFEYYNQEGVFLNDNGTPNNDADDFIQESDILALTLGINYKPCANVLTRPEIRWDFDDDELAGLDEGDSQTTFGIDTIFLF
ncbi:MAG: porin [Planctomycetota bacterium]